MMYYFVVLLLLAVFVLVCALVCVGRRFLRVRSERDMWKDVAEISAVGVVFFDFEGRFVMANNLACEYIPDFGELGTLRTNLRAALDYMYDHAVEYDDHLMGALEQSIGNADNMAFREIVMGRGVFYLVEARRLLNGSTVITLSNISKLCQREEFVSRLWKFNDQMREAVEAASSGIVVLSVEDGEASIIFSNNEFCRIFDVDGSAVIGQSLPDVFDDTDELSISDVACASVAALDHVDEEVCFYYGGGDLPGRWCDFKFRPVSRHGEEAELYVGVFTDTTDLKNREQEVSKSQKLEALGQMAAGVSHDFNNILSVVDGYARLTASDLDGDSPLFEYMMRVRKAAKRGSNLVSQMLSFSRHSIVSDGVVDLNVTIGGLELGELLNASIGFDVQLEDRPIFVEASNDDFSQILTNLIVNACDAMPLGGMLTVGTRICLAGDVPEPARSQLRWVDEYVCLCVRDNGEGVPRDVVDKIFDPFFTTKKQESRTGLGLSIVYGLVRKLGGAMHVETAVGEGAVFSIYIPVTKRALTKQVVGSIDDLSSFHLKGYTILLVEDEPDLRLLVGGMLRKLGAHVLEAANGNEALLVQDDYEGDIDLLLSDVVMPELNGIDLAELLVSLRPEVKTIFMSGYPAYGDATRAEIPQGVPFLAKPILYQDLVRSVHDSLCGGGGSGSAAPRWSSKKKDEEMEERL